MFLRTLLLFSLSLPAFSSSENIVLLNRVHGFSNPESALYDATFKRIYVSNVNGDANEKDGNGFLSLISTTGEIIEREWVKGMNAPKGLALHQNSLYVSDINELVEIDRERGTITTRYQAPHAKFLNDVAVDANTGDVYVSDMMDNTIYRLHNGEFSVWLASAELLSPNGLYVDGNRLIVASWGVISSGFSTTVAGHLKEVTLANKRISDIGSAAPIGNLDGLVMDCSGGFYATDWIAGKLLRIKSDGRARVLLSLEQGAADLDFIKESNTLLIPLMKTGQLLFYRARCDDDA